ncbi:MAG: transporter substrate-binding domain-containing protein [Candidatus Hermodarchaeota archaeon]
MRIRKKLILLVMLGAMVLATITVTNVTPATAQATGTLAEILARGYLIVGSDTTYPPFENMNETTGLAEGFDVDIAHQIALDIGVNLVIQTSEWEPIIPNLKQKKFDMIISAMTITAEREEEVDFSRWYYKSYQAILVPKGNPKSINSPSDLNMTDLRIGVQAGTTSFLWVQDNLDDNLIDLLTYDTILLAIEALKNGQVDVVLGDYAVLALDELESDETEVVGTYSPEDFGMAVREGDTDLLNAVNDALDDLLGSNLNNPNPSDLYNIIYYKWFGVSAGDVGYTGTVTTGTIPYAQVGAPVPGFELVTVFLALTIIPVVVILRKKRK